MTENRFADIKRDSVVSSQSNRFADIKRGSENPDTALKPPSGVGGGWELDLKQELPFGELQKLDKRQLAEYYNNQDAKGYIVQGQANTSPQHEYTKTLPLIRVQDKLIPDVIDSPDSDSFRGFVQTMLMDDPKEMAQALLKSNPQFKDYTLARTARGDLAIRKRGTSEAYKLNPTAMGIGEISEADLKRFGTRLGAFILGDLAASVIAGPAVAAGKGASMGARALREVGVGGATEAALQGVEEGFGGEFNLESVLWEAAGGALSVPAADLINRVGSTVSRHVNNAFVDDNVQKVVSESVEDFSKLPDQVRGLEVGQELGMMSGTEKISSLSKFVEHLPGGGKIGDKMEALRGALSELHQTIATGLSRGQGTPDAIDLGATLKQRMAKTPPRNADELISGDVVEDVSRRGFEAVNDGTYIDRFTQRARQHYNAITERVGADTLLSDEATEALISGASRIARNNPLIDAMQNGVGSAQRAARQIQDWAGNPQQVTYQDLTEFIQNLGDMLNTKSKASIGDNSTAQVEMFYGAAKRTQRVMADQAGALRLLNNADAFYSSGMKFIKETVDPLINTVEFKEIADKILEGDNSYALLSRLLGKPHAADEARRSLAEIPALRTPEERALVKSFILSNIGRAEGSVQKEVGGNLVNPKKLLNDWEALGPKTRELLFEGEPALKAGWELLVRTHRKFHQSGMDALLIGSKEAAVTSGGLKWATVLSVSSGAAASLVNPALAAPTIMLTLAPAVYSRLVTNKQFIKWVGGARTPMNTTTRLAKLYMLAAEHGLEDEVEQFVSAYGEAAKFVKEKNEEGTDEILRAHSSEFGRKPPAVKQTVSGDY